MEAKDTVIKLDADNESLRILMGKILLEQAEISFKAGYVEGKKYKQSVYDFAREQYEAGIRKAVNHLKNYYFIDVSEDMIKEIEEAK